MVSKRQPDTSDKCGLSNTSARPHRPGYRANRTCCGVGTADRGSCCADRTARGRCVREVRENVWHIATPTTHISYMGGGNEATSYLYHSPSKMSLLRFPLFRFFAPVSRVQQGLDEETGVNVCCMREPPQRAQYFTHNPALTLFSFRAGSSR